MGGNRDVCHCCRQPGHWARDCRNKQTCPWCGDGYVRWFEVVNVEKSKGTLFFNCSKQCGFFEWDIGQSSKAKDEIEDLSRMLKKFARIVDEDNVEITMNFTVWKGKPSGDDNGKGKMHE